MAEHRHAVFWSGLLVLLCTVAVYSNSFSAPLILDDSLAITQNPSIRSLWPLSPVFFPPAECTVAGRPVANLSFALNYALSGTAVWSYHVTNLALHVGAALLLLGIVRRSLLLIPAAPSGATDALGPWAARSLSAATFAALVWAVHPVLTAVVSYISQRTEVLMAFFYLLTLYAFVRAISGGAKVWWVGSVLACWLGMGSKEGMVTAPVLVLLYDACFVAGSFRQALKTRRVYYVALFASWTLLAFLLQDLSQRAVGFGLGVSWWRYAMTEAQAVLIYLRLLVWPHPLIFDYGAIFLENTGVAVGLMALVGLILAGAVTLLVKRPRIGLPLVAFFLILAPTSSVVPISAQPIAENRLYLAAAPLLALAAVGAFALPRRRAAVGLAIAVLVLGGVTLHRNEVFRDPLRLWSDTAAKRPQNPRVFGNLGELYFDRRQWPEARASFAEAIRLKPDFPEALNNLGTTLQVLGEPAESLRYFKEAVRVKPDYAAARNNLGQALLNSGQLAEAQQQFEEAVRLLSDARRLGIELPDAHNNLGNALLYQGKTADALIHYETATRLRPGFAQAEMNCGVALRLLGRLPEARLHLEAALRANSAFPEALYNLAIVLVQSGDVDGGRRQLEAAVLLKPEFGAALQALGDIAASQGLGAAAHTYYGRALQLNPGDSNLQQRWRATAAAAPNRP